MSAMASASRRVRPADDELVYLAIGPLFALLLGYALIPLRETIAVSTLSFAFVVLTVVIAAFGGRGAGIATALTSSLSMDFFLTQPYLSLRMDDGRDVIAFAGLTVCGLVAASLGSPQRIASLREMRGVTDALLRGIAELEYAGPLDEQLARVLGAAREVLPVRSLVVRDLADRVVVALPHSAGHEPPTPVVLEADTLLPGGLQHGLQGAPALADGRLAITFEHRRLGWLDLRSDGLPATLTSRRALTAVSRVAGAILARSGATPGAR
jgi:K+-sensing histidine kinase KdpD